MQRNAEITDYETALLLPIGKEQLSIVRQKQATIVGCEYHIVTLDAHRLDPHGHKPKEE